MGERPPIHSNLSSLRKIILKALTDKQVLLLKEIENNSTKTITSLSTKLSNKLKIPLSTLKLNSRLLKEFDLIEFETFEPVKLTKTGRIVLKIISDGL